MAKKDMMQALHDLQEATNAAALEARHMARDSAARAAQWRLLQHCETRQELNTVLTVLNRLLKAESADNE